MKDFFVHRYHNPGKVPHSVSRGFTAHIKEYPADHNQVYMSVAFCNPKDEFNKKIGRQTAMNGTYEIIKKRDVPRMLAACYTTMYRMSENIREDNFYYVFKYIV